MKKILIFIIVLVAMSLISGIAGSQVKGTISGRVTDESGNGIPHVYVSVNDYIFSYWINGSYTDSNGNYSIKVPAGTYNVQFKQLPSDGYYAPEWYNNKSYSPVADLVTVKAFQTTSNINAQLEIGGTIFGRVTDASEDGLPNVSVDAVDPNSSYWINGSDTDSSGNYSFNVPAGTYRVYFSPLPSDGYYAPEWYNNKSNSPVADLVTVTAFQTTSNINAQLEIGGTISGRVTYASWMGIANVYVGAAAEPIYNWMGGDSTDSKGNYSFNVPAGTYKVEFKPSINGYYAPEWYDTKSYFGVGDIVTVTAQTTSDIDAQLEIGGKITGRVTDVSGNWIVSVNVYAYDLNKNVINSTRTNSKGDYTILLAAGDYKVKFFLSPNPENYASQWYNNKSDFESADTVTVKKRYTNSNINAQIEPM